MSLKGLLSIALLAAAYLLSRSICLSQRLLQRCALVAFVVTGVTYAYFALGAEFKLAAVTHETYTSPIALMNDVDAATSMFQLDNNIRRTPAIIAANLVNDLPLDRVLIELTMVAKNDPYAPDIAKQIDQVMTIIAKRG